MARVPFVSRPADPITEQVFEIFDQEQRDPIALYQALANSPKLLRAYSTLAKGLRYEAETPRQLRELVILRVGQLTGSDYEWAHHRKMAADAGLPGEKVRELERWRESAAFDARERAALRCTDEVHELALTDQGFRELRSVFSDSEAVELVLLVAFYESVARVIQALGLEVEPEYRQYLTTEDDARGDG
jgi:alkylhydroperoxidase family enzyme